MTSTLDHAKMLLWYAALCYLGLYFGALSYKVAVQYPAGFRTFIVGPILIYNVLPMWMMPEVCAMVYLFIALVYFHAY